MFGMGKYHDLKHIFSSSKKRKESQARKVTANLNLAAKADELVPGAGAKYRKTAKGLAVKIVKNSK